MTPPERSQRVDGTIVLPEPLRVELAQLAQKANTSEGALIQRAVEALLQAQPGRGIPRYARRLGPLANR